MAARFDNGPTKLAAAVDALRVRNLHPKENLALRDFGGECGQDDGSAEIRRLAERPTMEELRERLHRREPVKLTVPAAQAVREERDAR
jgi:hypothetical protein